MMTSNKPDGVKKMISRSAIALSLVIVHFAIDTQVVKAQTTKPYAEYGDWTVACEQNQTNKKKCAMWQVASTSDEAPRLLHVEISFYQPFQNAELLIILPLGISLITQPSLYIDQQPGFDLQVSHCIADGCYIRTKLTAELLEKFLHMNSAILRLTTFDGQQVELPISGTGSRAAFNSAKED